MQALRGGARLEKRSKIRTLPLNARRAGKSRPMVRKAAELQRAGDADAGSPGENPLSYEDAVSELEQLVQRMEGGTLSLEESLAAYRRGAELVAHCRKTLADVQQQVKVLEGDLLKPFEPEQGNGGGG
jgi:exodeoxyribonuclease VII small subunit